MWKLMRKLFDRKNKLVDDFEQLRAERLRVKRVPVESGTIRYGLHYQQNPLDFIKDAIERRRRLREEKEQKK